MLAKPFSRYMHEWLYGEDGYYTHHRIIGKEGDFYTAVSTSMFFGGSIACNADTISGLSPTCSCRGSDAHKGYLWPTSFNCLCTLKPSLLETLSFVR